VAEPTADETRRTRLLGADAVVGALEAGRPVRLVLHPEGRLSEAATRALARARAAGVPVVCAGEGPIWRLTAGSPGAELLGLVGPDPGAPLDSVLARRGALWLLAGTAYPGNAGFVIRTAEVSGADGVVIDAGFDRPKRREALRASMRADRYLPVFFERAEPVVAAARAAGRRVLALETSGDLAPWETDLRGPVVFVLGGERSGIPPALLEAADVALRVPMAGFIASYNLQAAMAVVAAERMRQEARGDGRAT